MNVPEIYCRLEDVQNKLSHLQTLALNNPDMVLHADRQGKIHSTVNPAKGKSRAVITYENLWRDASCSMFDTITSQLEDIERILIARLMDASCRIQADLYDSCGPGTISYWRACSEWQQTYLHQMWEYRHRMVFVDGYKNNSGLIETFICMSNLAEMPYEYQVSFINNFWGKHFTNTEETIVAVDAPPPMTDDENLSMLIAQQERGEYVSGLCMLH